MQAEEPLSAFEGADEAEGQQGVRAAAANSPEPVASGQAEEEREEDSMVEADRCAAWSRANAMSSPEPEIMMEEEEEEDDDVQFIGEKGPGVHPMSSCACYSISCSTSGQ